MKVIAIDFTKHLVELNRMVLKGALFGVPCRALLLNLYKKFATGLFVLDCGLGNNAKRTLGIRKD
jgi:hypothetical protein